MNSPPLRRMRITPRYGEVLQWAWCDEPIHKLIDQSMAAGDGGIRGLPDVVAFWDDGLISLQQLKRRVSRGCWEPEPS